MKESSLMANFPRMGKLGDMYIYTLNSAQSGEVKIIENEGTMVKLLKDREVYEAFVNAHRRGVEIKMLLTPEPEKAYLCFKSLEVPIPNPLYKIGKNIWKNINKK